MIAVFKTNMLRLFDFVKSKVFLRYFLMVLLFALIFFYSGYTIARVDTYRIYFNALLIIFSISLILYYIVSLPIPNETKKPKEILIYFLKQIRFDLPLFYLLFVALSALVSMAVNNDFGTTGLRSFIATVSVFLAAFGFVKVVKFKDAIRTFRKIFPWLCLVSLLLYGLINIFKIYHPFMSFETSIVAYDNYFFVYFNYIVLSNRNCSIFWEPATFSLFLCVGVIIELVCSKDKFRIWVMLLYFISLASTFSISGFVILFVSIFTSVLLLTKEQIDKNFITLIILIILCGGAVSALIFLKPELLQKISFEASSGSLSTRVLGPYINLRIMLDHPLGVGFTNEYSTFLSYVGLVDLKIDAQTCAFGYWMSTFGFPGLFITLIPMVALFFIKGIKLPAKIVLIPLALLFMVAEPIQTNLAFLLFSFYVLEEFDFFGRKVAVEKGDLNYRSLASRFLNNSKNSTFAKNSLGSFVVKGLAMLVSLFTTTAYISYFADPKGTGMLAVWFTILSVLTWILVFDLGIGHGLKNKLIAAYEVKDDERVKRLISSSYVSTAVISMLILALGSVGIWLGDMYAVFNISPTLVDATTLKLSLWIILLAICLNFVLKIVGNIFESLQKQGVSNAFAILNTLILLIFASSFWFTNNEQRLIGIAIAYLVASTVPLIIATIYLFLTKFKTYRLSFKYVSLTDMKSVISLGGLFFIIQICMLLINSTNTFIIQQLYASTTLGATAQFTYYHKIYNVAITIVSLVSGPLWAIVAKAKSSGDMKYVKAINKVLFIIAGVFIVFDLLVFACLPLIFQVWIPNAEFTFSWVANAVFALTSVIVTISVLFTTISNGLSKLKFQIAGFIAGLCLKIGSVAVIAILLSKGFNIPWYTIELTSALAYLPVFILVPIGNHIYLRKTNA